MASASRGPNNEYGAAGGEKMSVDLSGGRDGSVGRLSGPQAAAQKGVSPCGIGIVTDRSYHVVWRNSQKRNEHWQIISRTQ